MVAPFIAKDVRDYLVNTAGFTDVAIGMLGETPVNQIAVIEYTGMGSVKIHGTGLTALEQVRLQIQVRNRNKQDAGETIHAIKDALDGLSNVTIGGTVYTYFSEVSPPRILAVEQSGAAVYIFEVTCQCRR
jgi:hypothetical protein